MDYKETQKKRTSSRVKKKGDWGPGIECEMSIELTSIPAKVAA